jgi:predicted nucleic acid-binding protein
VIAVDSSVVIAGFATWHEQHAAAVKVLGQRPRLVAHAAIETYSVLTRLPPPHRSQPGLVQRFLRSWFLQTPLTLPAGRYLELVDTLAEQEILGGQIYDALIGCTAAEHGATLISLDRRAALVYEAVWVRVEALGSG